MLYPAHDACDCGLVHLGCDIKVVSLELLAGEKVKIKVVCHCRGSSVITDWNAVYSTPPASTFNALATRWHANGQVVDKVEVWFHRHSTRPPLPPLIAARFPVRNEGLPWTIQHNSYALLRPGNCYVESRCGARIKRLASLQKG